MSYNGSGTFNINTSGQPVVTGTVISSTAFNALTSDLGTGLSTAITKDGQTTATARIPFAAGINSSLVTDATSTTTGSIITAGGVGIAKALYVGTTLNVAGASTLAAITGTFNGTVGATTPSTGAFTTLSATGKISTTQGGTSIDGVAIVPAVNTDRGLFRITNLSSDTLFGAQGSAASIITVGSSNYDACIRSTSGIAFSADGGSNAQMRLNSTGAIALAGAVSATGVGITFPATQSASTNANTLDDYEEGTFTPSLGGTATYNTQNGYYTKIGRLVTCQIEVEVALIGTGSATTVSGFPFSAVVNSGGFTIYWNNVYAAYTTILPFMGSNDCHFETTNAAVTGVTDTNNIFKNGARIIFTTIYHTT